MTSNQISEQLATMGVRYTPDAVRKAWSRGAPRSNAKAFAIWIAQRSKNKTGAAADAASALGLASPGATVGNRLFSVKSPCHGAALAVDAFRRLAVPLWAVHSALTWATLNADYEQDAVAIGEVLGPEFVEASVELIKALKRIVGQAPGWDAKLRDAGYTADATDWIQATGTPGGLEVLLEIANSNYDAFCAMPDGEEAPRARRR